MIGSFGELFLGDDEFTLALGACSCLDQDKATARSSEVQGQRGGNHPSVFKMRMRLTLQNNFHVIIL